MKDRKKERLREAAQRFRAAMAKSIRQRASFHSAWIEASQEARDELSQELFGGSLLNGVGFESVCDRLM